VIHGRQLALAGVIAAIALTAVVWLIPRKRFAPPAVRVDPMPLAAEPHAAPPTAPLASQPQPTPARSATARTRGSPLAAELNAPGFDAQHDVATLHAMLRQYLQHLRGRQGHPVGNDSDLARVLTGHNSMKLVILPVAHSALTPDWATVRSLGHTVLHPPTRPRCLRNPLRRPRPKTLHARRRDRKPRHSRHRTQRFVRDGRGEHSIAIDVPVRASASGFVRHGNTYSPGRCLEIDWLHISKVWLQPPGF
jgi:hypothetical protein